MSDLRVGVLARILAGEHAGWFVEIVEDAASTGGLLILVHPDRERTGDGYDAWVESITDAEGYFAESGWQVEWLEQRDEVWIFQGSGASFPSGVFVDEAQARAWIRAQQLTGLLTKYPLGQGVFDWAVQQGYFTPKKPEHHSAKFIGRFTSAAMEHYHFEDGHE